MKLWILVSLLFAHPLYAGPFTHSGGYQAAAMNTHGDFIIAGDKKALLRIDGRFLGQVWRSQPHWLHTVGMSAPEDDQPQAIFCNQKAAYLFTADEQATNSIGRISLWKSRQENQLPFGRGFLCAMTHEGQYGALDTISHIVHLKGRSVAIPKLSGDRLFFLTHNGHFLVISSNGSFLRVSEKGVVEQGQGSLPWLSLYSQVAGGSQEFYVADDYGVYAYQLTNRQGQLSLGNRRSLGLNPCDDEQICALHVAQDDSLAISGYWGTYLVTQGGKTRLRATSSPGKYGGVAFAHSGGTGSFVFAGAWDSDMGPLAAWRVQPGDEPDSRPAIPPGRPPSASDMAVTAEAPWWVTYLKRDEAWQYLADSGVSLAQIKVGILDTGAALDHPMIRPSLWQNPLETQNQRDDDKDGFVDDLNGFDFVDEDALPMDPHGHGTHVAGLVAAKDPLGRLSGFGKNALLIIARGLDAKGHGHSIDLARGIHYLLDRGARIINCSWGGGSDTVALRNAFARAEALGVMMFVAAGNAGLSIDQSPPVPGRYPGVINVGAIDAAGKRSSFSNYSPTNVAFMAPGEDILSTIPPDKTGLMSGTSMASPLGTAVATVLLGMDPSLKPQEALAAICSGSKPGAGGRSSECGGLDGLGSLR